MPNICYCCMTKSDNFYVNSKTGNRTKHCRDCGEKYTAKERKQKETFNVLQAMKNVK